LVLEGPSSYRLPTRAVSSMNLGPDGSIVLAHVEPRVTRVSREGAILWTVEIPKCGSPALVVGYNGEVVNACGYSLLKHAPDGKLLFQKWPFGNTRIGVPLLARDGTMIVSGGGVVAFLDADGEPRTKLPTGNNRYVHALGVLTNGDIVFRTTMAEMHSSGPIHFYYDHEPPELFIVTRAGALKARSKAESPWPESLPFTPDLRAGRLP
jgi:hypothetical protein